MSVLRALVVDDSKTARFRLNKLLSRYDLEVDTASSAEEALSYISHTQPVVIFMDHHMEGMDGLNALKIIKANPSTATIPVIMYTSQEGDVYAGQAYALGALDILSKDLMKPATVNEALSKLHLPIPLKGSIHKDGFGKNNFGHDSSTLKPGNDAQSAVVPKRRRSDHEPKPAESSTELKQQISRLFELHVADVRSQFSEHSQFIVNRLQNEIETSKRDNSELDSNLPIEIVEQEARAVSIKMGIVSSALLSVILLGLAALSYQIYHAQQSLNQISLKTQALEDQSLQAPMPQPQAHIVQPVSVTDSQSALFAILSWSTQINWQYSYSEEALNPRQIQNLQDFIYQLDDAGFEGIVEVNLHLGDYCLENNDLLGGLKLKTRGAMKDCLLRKEGTDDIDSTDQAGSTLAQLENNFPPLKRGHIRIELHQLAFDSPTQNYPDAFSASVESWNSIAQQNNRIDLNLRAFEP